MFRWPERLRPWRSPPVAAGTDIDPGPAASVAEASGPEGVSPESLVGLIEAIERTALEVFGLHDLPTVRGHYGRSPRARRWRFLDESLTAQERFALVMANPKWKFSTLEALGREASANKPDLAAAADLLTRCSVLRGHLSNEARLDAGEIEALIRLGADWRLMEARLERRRSGPLKLTFTPRKRAPRASG